ncbi:MAG: hypothetical protein PVI86_17805 [Phycisphaerae bacterium]|jgi:hypothetical protein
MRQVPEQTGIARTVLVFGEGPTAQAAISQVVVRLARRKSRKRFLVRGDVQIDDEIVRHLQASVLPVADRICRYLGLTQRSFTVSIVALAVAEVGDVKLRVTGHSMDVPILLALLSARLRLPLRQDLLTTGALSTEAGIIVPVRGIPSKLAAAAEHTDINRFVLPSVDEDRSLCALSPRAREEIIGAIARAKDQLDVVAVHDVAELVERTFDMRGRIVGALRGGYLRRSSAMDVNDDPTDRAALLLAEDHEGCFWKTLEELLLNRRASHAKQLLATWVRYHIDRRTYPTRFGEKLSQLLASLPPTTRRLRTLKRLIPVEQCAKLAHVAGKQDLDDLEPLFRAAARRVTPRPTTSDVEGRTAAQPRSTDVAEAVLIAISAETVAINIGIPIDTARDKFRLEDIVVESNDEFHDICTSFYRHLLRHVGAEGAPLDGNWVELGAVALIERAFAGKGGIEAAKAEARWAIRGGMALVLNVLTQQFKHEQQAAYVDRMLQESIGPLNWKGRVSFISALLERLGPMLPPEVRRAPPERFAGHDQELAQAYARSFDQLDTILRRL